MSKGQASRVEGGVGEQLWEAPSHSTQEGRPALTVPVGVCRGSPPTPTLPYGVAVGAEILRK